MYLRNGKVGVYDLASKELEEQELSEEDSLQSLKIAERLAADHGPDPLILGTGVLTASFVPASCAGFVWARGAFMPVLGFAGVELKLSGFDFVVIKGRGSKQGYLWIRDGMVEFVESEGMASLDSWRRTDKIRADQGDGKIQVLSIGPWGDLSKPAAQVVVDYWGGEDKVGMGAEFGRRNLGAVAFRGMGELDLNEPEKHFEDAVLLMSEHIQKLGKNHGLASYSDVASRDDFTRLFHRAVACYGCPYPCRSYLKVFEDANEFRLVAKEPGYLHYDVPALAKAFASGLDAKDATIAIMKCARAGAEPVSVMSAASSPGLEAIDATLSKPSVIKNVRAANFESSFVNMEDYTSAVGLGVCPRYWAKVGFDFEAVAAYAQSALDLKPL
jgi:aldehyde:ferredoxin oxidoreductase